MQKTYQVGGATAFTLTASLRGGHTMVATLWYDEEGPGWWNVAGQGGHSIFSWNLGPLAGTWKTSVRTLHEYDSELPFQPKIFKFRPGMTYEFWLDLRASSNTDQPIDFIVDLLVEQGDVEIPPDDGMPSVLLKPGRVSVDNYVKLIFV